MAGFGTFMMIASTMVSVAGQIQAGNAAKKAGAIQAAAANEEAKQLEHVAGQARAPSFRSPKNISASLAYRIPPIPTTSPSTMPTKALMVSGLFLP